MPTEAIATNNTLVYVDRPLANAIAAKLIGVLHSNSVGGKRSVSVNWLVGGEVGAESSQGTSFDIRELLPEDLVYQFFPLVKERHTTLESALPKLTAGTGSGLLPGSPISIQGKLRVPEFTDELLALSSTPPGEIGLPSRPFHGEPCVGAFLVSSDYSIPIYFAESAKYQIPYCHDQPVEVTGVLRWVPPYSPGGAKSLNLAVRCAALWLR